jgi:hypothetical protein
MAVLNESISAVVCGSLQRFPVLGGCVAGTVVGTDVETKGVAVGRGGWETGVCVEEAGVWVDKAGVSVVKKVGLAATSEVGVAGADVGDAQAVRTVSTAATIKTVFLVISLSSSAIINAISK